MYNLHDLWYTHSSLARLPDRAPRQQTVNATSEVPLIPIFPVMVWLFPPHPPPVSPPTAGVRRSPKEESR